MSFWSRDFWQPGFWVVGFWQEPVTDAMGTRPGDPPNSGVLLTGPHSGVLLSNAVISGRLLSGHVQSGLLLSNGVGGATMSGARRGTHLPEEKSFDGHGSWW
jgi:hypothetical protein